MPYTLAQLTAYYTAVNLGQAPDASTATTLNQVATANAAGNISDQAALSFALQNIQVRATTDVAVAVYQYFNGSAPSAAGLQFLVNNPGTGLNTTYYNGATGTPGAPSAGGFNLENRYYNLAVSQAFQGPNAAQFAATYGALTLQQTVATAYEQIVSAAVVGSAQANAAIAAIQGSIPFFQQVAAERATGFNQDLAAKAIIVGYILEESVKADVGAYALAMDQHNASIAAGNALYNTNILTAYGPGGPGFGTGVGGGVIPTNLPGSSIAQQRLNLGPGAQVNINGTLSGGTTLQLRDASGSADVLNLQFANGNATGAQGVNGVSLPQLALGGTAAAGTIETVNVLSTGNFTGAQGGENGMTFSPATAPNTVNIRGAQPFFLLVGAVTHSMLLDGTAATASLTLRGDTATAAGVAININGGSADDTLEPGQSSTAVAQTIYGGGGGDLILLNGGVYNFNTDTLTGAAATHKPIDTIVYKAVTDSIFDSENDPGANRLPVAAAQIGKTDNIYGFISGQDKIDVKGLSLTQAQLTLVDKGNVADLTAFNALVASGNFYKDSGGVIKGVTELHNNGDTYLAFDVNHNGAFDATGDLVIKLVGTAVIVAGDLVGN